MYKLKLINYTLLIILCASCVSIKRKPAMTPARPVMKQVQVKNGSISGESLSNAIENHTNLWIYAEKLEVMLGISKNH